MKKQIITIDENTVHVPDKVCMTISEIAYFFDIYQHTAKKCIRSIEKSGITEGYYTMDCVVEGLNVYPVYYGLEMVIAVAYRIHSPNAKIFREWLIERITKSPIIIRLSTLQVKDKFYLN